MKFIPLTRGKYSIVDDEDYDYLNQWKWCCHTIGYAVRGVGNRRVGTYNLMRMHREVLSRTGASFDCVDHIDGVKLNNLRGNLRPATKITNGHNRGKNRNNRSGFKGVSYHKQSGRWTAEIMFSGKRKRLGLFASPEEAHAAYMKTANELHGEFAHG